MTEEQVEMLMAGLVWMGIVEMRPVVEDRSESAWNHLRGLIDK